MWICSKFGFFSIVKKGKPGTWQIRARREPDLRELLNATGLDAEVIPTPKADYAFRIVVGKKELSRVLSVMGDSIDYSNFKNCIASLPRQRDNLPAYHDFWSGMLRVQQKAILSQGTKSQRPKARTREEIFKTHGGFLNRILITIRSFKDRHGHWPTKLRLFKDNLEALQDTDLTPLGFQILKSKLQLVAGDKLEYVAEDDAGHTFEYGQQEGPNVWEGAAEWLWGVKIR